MTHDPLRLWQRPTPGFLDRVQAALLRAGITALLLSLLYILAVGLVSTTDSVTREAEPAPELGTLLPSAGLFAVATFLVLAPLFVLLSTRPMQDRAFTTAGFVATFSSLAVLLVFFFQLGRDAADWFVQTPRLIERQNERLQAAPRNFERDELAKVYRELDESLAQIDADPTKTVGEKKTEKAELRELFQKELIPDKKKDLAPTLAELHREAERDVRTDTSPGAIFWYFLTHGAAPLDRPQDAGIWFALLGSLWMGLITVLFAVPVGVGAAIYLEEYRSNTWLSRVIQVNINNLAGVPSVVYGILGAFVFVGLIFQPLHRQHEGIQARNVLGGGLTLGLLTLPVVIVAAQEAIRAVPSSIRHGAIALGATRWQTTWHTVLPMSLPGILTGAILSLSRAIGEAAPLLLFGAIMYVDETPSLLWRFTILPMQIFGWARRPPTTLADGTAVDAWRNNAAMASTILLVTLLAMNALAIYLRNRTQRHSHY